MKLKLSVVFIFLFGLTSLRASNLYIVSGGFNSCGQGAANDHRAAKTSEMYRVFKQRVKLQKGDDYIFTCFNGNGFRFFGKKKGLKSGGYGVRTLNSRSKGREAFMFLERTQQYFINFIKRSYSYKRFYKNIIVIGHSHGTNLGINYLKNVTHLSSNTYLFTIDPISQKYCKFRNVLASRLKGLVPLSENCRRFPPEFDIHFQSKVITNTSSWVNYFQKDCAFLSSGPAAHPKVENYNICSRDHRGIKKDHQIWDRVLRIR
ncbi:hypothetical protein N9O57_01275 [bacterium]|nr:hypothetical protein [bacterium]